MFNLSHHPHHHAPQAPAARRPSSARAIMTGSASSLPARRLKSARAQSGAQPGGGPIMKPPWALDNAPVPIARQGVLIANSSTCGRCSIPDALTHPKITVSGHKRLSKPKGTPQNRIQKVIHGQWAPAEILGPALPQRSRFDKSSGIFVEGLSAAAWAMRKMPKREKTAESSVAAESEEEEEVEEVNFNRFDDDEQDADEGDEYEGEEILPDFEAFEMERLAEEEERLAREKFEQAQKQVEAMTAERVETTRKLAMLESILQRAISDSESDSSDEDEDEVEGEEKDTVGEEQGGREGSMLLPSVPRSPDKVSKKKTKPESSRFKTQQRAAQRDIDQIFTHDVKKKMKDGGINKEDYAKFLSEQQMIGGAISLQDVHEAFDRAKRPTDHLMDKDGFLESIQELRSKFGVDIQELDDLNTVVDNAKEHMEKAETTRRRIGDQVGVLRMQMAKRKLNCTAGDAKMKQAQSINLENLKEEEEIKLLQSVQALMYDAVGEYTAALVQEKIKPVVQKIIGLNARLGRVQANRSNFRCANVMIRQTLILCSKYEVATTPQINQGQETAASEEQDAETGVWPELQDVLNFAKQLYSYSEELKYNSIKSLEHAGQRLLLEDYDAVLTSLLVCEALEKDAMLVRGVSLKNKSEVCVLMPQTSQPASWNWTWMEHTRSDAWHETANTAIDQMYSSLQMYLAQGVSTKAVSCLQTLTKFTRVLGLHNPGELLMRAVETERRNEEALNSLRLVVSTAQRTHHYAGQLKELLGDALLKCSDADDYLEHGEQQGSPPVSPTKQGHLSESESRDGKLGLNDYPHTSRKARFWHNKWQETGKDTLTQVVCLGIESLVAKAGKKNLKASKESNKTNKSPAERVDDVQERIERVQKLLDVAQQLCALLLERFEGPEAGKSDLKAILRPLENALSAELEGRWLILYEDKMKSAEEKMREHNLKATRLLLDRARKMYVEGTRLQNLAQKQREADQEADDIPSSQDVSLDHTSRDPKTARSSQTQLGEMHVQLPAEWHAMQAKLEALGVDGFARAKTHWIKVSTKLQVVNGCVDFVNLSQLIKNVKLDKKALENSDSDSDSESNRFEKDEINKKPKYVHVDHNEMVEKLRKATSLTQSKVLSVVDFQQHRLEMLDYCKLRLLSAGEVVAKQGEALPYFMFILRGSLKLVLPLPDLEEQRIGCEGRQRSVLTDRKKSLKSVDAEVHSKSVRANEGSEIAHFGARRILGESHNVLQKPYYAHIISMQDETEVLEFHVPPDTLTILKSRKCSNDSRRGVNVLLESTVGQEEIASISKTDGEEASSNGIWRLTSADERVQAAHKSLENAFFEVRNDEDSIQRAVNLALNKTVSSVGYSKILTSLGSSLLQALLEGASTLQYHKNQVLMEQGDKADHIFLVISGRFQLLRSSEEGEPLPAPDFAHSQTAGNAPSRLSTANASLESESGADLVPAREPIHNAPEKVMRTQSFDLEPGDVVGEEFFLQASLATSTCRCTKLGKVLKIALWSFQPILQAKPEFLHTLGFVARS